MSVDSDSVLNPPPSVKPPPGPVDAIEAALNDESNYLSAEEWFSEIQDDGIELTGLVLNPPWGGTKKGCFFKNMISPPKN